MPIVEQSGLNWAREIDEKETEIEVNEEGYKKVIEYKTENEKKYKITNVFRVEKVRLPKSVAQRKEWKKFGDSESDAPGLNPATTIITDEVLMQFLTKKEEVEKTETPAPASVSAIKCRLCKGDHWSAKCPHKDILEAKLAAEANQKETAASASTGAYVPPSRRPGANALTTAGKKVDFGKTLNKDDFSVRVSNLPEEATETDLQELFKPFGKVTRVFLAKDKTKQVSRGFAFVTFSNKDEAQRAIWGVNDYGYNHLILKVEWSK
ncbi:eukaryotic translation initiation factor 3 subunit G [Brachionus plicatilis]|uniref:Eukaryotic translation initiation factor 3 subunit G n=1 Tax=Brachionus plicatilis TaxID=10195 RepID=A0A3M7SR01_BRAPC|nr:eukaryotic translation initiation factor 3 subunit G [Brachionus plicatilis]